jgi:DNA-binding XRE family transcriptional regulator
VKPLYLPYSVELDPETRTYCIVGIDSRGNGFGVGSGPTIEESERTLRAHILEVLSFHATEGDDLFGDLHSDKPRKGSSYLVFGPTELIPIRLRLARERAKLRQADMAERLGITQQAYAKLERPGANPTLRTLIQAEQALGAPLLNWV